MAKFLTYESRLEIEAGLREHLTFTDIGTKLLRDRTTISKEVRLYSVEQCSGYSVFHIIRVSIERNAKRKMYVEQMAVNIL